jgi:copper transport protein
MRFLKHLIGLLLVSVAILATTGNQPASAHAVLLSSDPPDGQTLTDAPRQITLRFSESVTPTRDAIRIHDSSGQEVDTPPVRHADGTRNAITVDAPVLEPGGYIVLYRVISADSHSIQGTLNFSVGTSNPVTDNAGLTRTLLSAERTDTDVRILHNIVRGIVLISAVLAIGALVMLHILPGSPGPRFARTFLVVLAVSTALGILSHSLYVNAAAITAILDADLVTDTLMTNYGAGALLRLAAVIAALVLMRHRVTAFCAAALIALSFGIAGHAGTGRLPALGLALDLVHVLAGSIWFAGLIIVLVAVRRSDENSTVILQRFSRIALICATAVFASGVLQAIRQLDSFHALTSTDHGRLIIAKAALFAIITAAAARARALTQRPTTSSAKKYLAVEVLFATAVLVVTVVLVGTSPNASAGERAYERTSTLGSLRVALHVDPASVGTANATVRITDPNGVAVDVPDVAMTLTLANEGIGPFRIDLQKQNVGEFATNSMTVPSPGKWTVRVVIRTSDVDQSSTSFAVPINPS